MNKLHRVAVRVASGLRVAAVNSEDEAKVQRMLDEHWDPEVKGEKLDPSSIFEAGSWVVLFTKVTADHIAAGHAKRSEPGSYFDPSVDVRKVALDVIGKVPPTQNDEKYANWFEVDLSRPVGLMGVAKGDPEQVKQMPTRSMNIRSPSGNERSVTFPVSKGKRTPTSVAAVITEKCGKLPDGREVLYVATMWPGGSSVDGVKIPRERSEFADLGLYFVIE